MRVDEILNSELVASKIDSSRVVDLIVSNHGLVDIVFHELSNKSPRVRFGCSKSLVSLSEKNPAALLKKTNAIIGLLGSDNRILKWNAIAMIGNLVAADSHEPRDAELHRLYRFLLSGELITANHSIAALAKIARAFPKKRRQIIKQLLAIEQAEFVTGECRDIAIGKVILAVGEIFGQDKILSPDAAEFAMRQVSNRRKATAKKAESLLRQYVQQPRRLKGSRERA